MSDIASILEGIDPQSFARLERSVYRARRAAVLVNVVMFVGLLAVTVWALWQGWQSGNWLTFWFPPIFALIALANMVGPSVNVLSMLRHDGEVAQALRRAAASSDERVAPLASGQLSALADDSRVAATAQSAYLRSFVGSRRLASLQAFWFLPLIYAAMLSQLVFVTSNPLSARPVDTFCE